MNQTEKKKLESNKMGVCTVQSGFGQVYKTTKVGPLECEEYRCRHRTVVGCSAPSSLYSQGRNGSTNRSVLFADLNELG